jgi:hypothetical protein
MFGTSFSIVITSKTLGRWLGGGGDALLFPSLPKPMYMCSNHLLLFNHATATCSTGPADDETFFPYTLWWKPIQFWNIFILYLRKQWPLRKEAMAQSEHLTTWDIVNCSLVEDYIVMLMFHDIQNITRCNPVKVNRCFGGTHPVHVSGLTSNPTDGNALHIKFSTVSESI